MNDDEAVQVIQGALRTLYPEPEDVDIDISTGIAPRRPRRVTILLTAACVIAVVALAVVLTRVGTTRKGTQPLGSATGEPTSSVAVPSPGRLTVPSPQPVIVGGRLTEPFSISRGQIQLTPLPANYEPKITPGQAAGLLSGDEETSPPAVTQPPLFLATLINYSGPFSAAAATRTPNPHSGPTPVWVSLQYVQQVEYGPGTPSFLPGLSDQITTINADTGKVTSGIDVAGPDPTPSTAPPGH